MGIVLSVIGVVFMRPVSILLGATDAMIEDCVLYGRIVISFTAAYTILIYHLKRRSGGIIQEIKNRNLVKKICVDGGEKRIFHQFLMKKLLHLILMQTVLLK